MIQAWGIYGCVKLVSLELSLFLTVLADVEETSSTTYERPQVLFHCFRWFSHVTLKNVLSHVKYILENPTMLFSGSQLSMSVPCLTVLHCWERKILSNLSVTVTVLEAYWQQGGAVLCFSEIVLSS